MLYYYSVIDDEKVTLIRDSNSIEGKQVWHLPANYQLFIINRDEAKKKY